MLSTHGIYSKLLSLYLSSLLYSFLLLLLLIQNEYLTLGQGSGTMET